MITPADFKTRFPEYTSVDDARIQLFIDDAVLEIDEAAWGDLYDKGLLYLTAHFLTIAESTSSGNSGGVAQTASQSVDGVSIAYATPSADSASASVFASTAYGQEFMRLKKLLGPAVYSV